MANSHDLSAQWASRPADQRFLSIATLHAHNVAKRERAIEKGGALDHMAVRADDQRGVVLFDPKSTGSGAALNHWAFGQLASRVGAPAGYLRELPPALAAIPLQWSLEHAREDGKLLLRADMTRQQAETSGRARQWTVDAITSDSYGRIFDAELTEALQQNLDLSVWKVPSASYASKNPKRATTLYASDRDCFVCLVDDQHPITVPGTGENEVLFRGLIARNSEVGAATLELKTFLYRYICDNRIIWGQQDVQEIRIRHTSGGPMRFVREAKPALEAYLTSGTAQVVAGIKAASAKEVGKSEKDVTDWLKARGFTTGQSKRAVELASLEPGVNPRSIWGVVQGLTAQAHEVPFGDERLDLEVKAGKLMSLVA